MPRNRMRLSPDGVELQPHHANQFAVAWNGLPTPEGAPPLQLTQVSEPDLPAATISNADPDGGHLTVVASDGTTPLLTVTDQGITGSFGETGDLKWSFASADHGPWLKCDGRSMLVASYASLSAMLRPLLGGADAAHFTLPSGPGKTLGMPGGALGALGTTTGAATVGAAHNHTLNGHTHTLNGHTHGLSSHTHSLNGHSHGMNSHTHGAGTYDVDIGHSHSGSVTVDSTSLGHNGGSGGGTQFVDQQTHDHSGSITVNANVLTQPVNGTGAAATGNTAGDSSASGGPNTADTSGNSSASAGPNTPNTSDAGGSLSTIQPTLSANLFVHI